MSVICVFQHVPYERPGTIAEWAKERGHRLQMVRVADGEIPPAPAHYDALIVLGGPMGVYEAPQYPWMAGEMAAIAAALDAQKPILGICLGSQLLAHVLGAAVYPHREKEIGWFPIRLNDAGKAHPWFAGFGDEPLVYHWHGDTFDLPDGAQLLASSEATPHQIYLYGNALGLQCHPEVVLCDVQAWIDACEALPDGRFVQRPDEMVEAHEACATMKSGFFRMLDGWFTA